LESPKRLQATGRISYASFVVVQIGGSWVGNTCGFGVDSGGGFERCCFSD
jgi:hypothetical protein